MLTYESYLTNKDHLTFEQAKKIYETIVQYHEKHDTIFKELFRDMNEAATKYAIIRANWAIKTLEERNAIDESRTIQHNNYMATLTILARYMKNKGWEFKWFENIGSIEKDRKRLGDLACYFTCINALNAR